MPRATVKQDTLRVDLKSCPPDGYVELRQLPFYEMLVRRDNAMKVSMEVADNGASASQRLQFANAWVSQFEFEHCIIDHNLEDDNGGKLNFSNPMTLKILDPRVGLEIQQAIDDLNQGPEEDARDFTPAAPSSLLEENGTRNEDMELPK